MNSNEEKQTPEMPPMPKRRCGRRRWMIAPMILVALAIKGGIFFLLWNALIPDLFHGPMINFGQAIGLIVLAKLLGGHHFGHRGFGPFGRHHHWKHMSAEEREKLRAAFRERFSR